MGVGSLKLIVLGHCGAFAGPGRACPGYLVTAGRSTVVLDLGSGCFARLQRFCDYRLLDAIVLSHLHGDHMSDLLVARYAIEFSLRSGARASALEVLAPGEPAEEFNRLRYKDALQLTAIDSEKPVTIGEMTFTFAAGEHSLPCYAVAVEAEGKRLVYSGDTGYSAAVARLARGADLFLCESTLPELGGRRPQGGHLSGREAAQLARESGVRRLLLTHFWPECPVEAIVEEAAAVFGPGVEAAVEEKEYEV